MSSLLAVRKTRSCKNLTEDTIALDCKRSFKAASFIFFPNQWSNFLDLKRHNQEDIDVLNIHVKI